MESKGHCRFPFEQPKNKILQQKTEFKAYFNPMVGDLWDNI